MREALRDLELLRLVESEPFRGAARARVRRGGADRDLSRSARRSRSSRPSSRRRSSRVTSRRSRSSSRRCARPSARDDTNALAQHDIAFHRLIVEAAGNSVLEQCWKSLGVEGRITISLYGTYMDPEQAAERHVQADRRDPLGQRECRRARGPQARRGLGPADARPAAKRGDVTVVLVGHDGSPATESATRWPSSCAEWHPSPGPSPAASSTTAHRQLDDPNTVCSVRALRRRAGARGARREPPLPGARPRSRRSRCSSCASARR